MSCHQTYDSKDGLVFESWVGEKDGTVDCYVLDGDVKGHLLRVKSDRNDRGELDFRAETSDSFTSKQLLFRHPVSSRTKQDSWSLRRKAVPAHTSFTEEAEIARNDIQSDNEDILATIVKCKYPFGREIRDVVLTLAVKLR